jgi:hypothetical protein
MKELQSSGDVSVRVHEGGRELSGLEAAEYVDRRDELQAIRDPGMGRELGDRVQVLIPTPPLHYWLL